MEAKGIRGAGDFQCDATEEYGAVGKYENFQTVLETHLENHLDNWEHSMRRIWFSTSPPDRFVWRNEAPPPGPERLAFLKEFYDRYSVHEASAFED